MYYKNKLYKYFIISICVFLLSFSIFYYLYTVNTSSIDGKKLQKTVELVEIYNKKNADLFVEKSQFETIYYIQARAEELNMKNVTTTFALSEVSNNIPTLR